MDVRQAAMSVLRWIIGDLGPLHPAPYERISAHPEKRRAFPVHFVNADIPNPAGRILLVTLLGTIFALLILGIPEDPSGQIDPWGNFFATFVLAGVFFAYFILLASMNSRKYAEACSLFLPRSLLLQRIFAVNLNRLLVLFYVVSWVKAPWIADAVTGGPPVLRWLYVAVLPAVLYALLVVIAHHNRGPRVDALPPASREVGQHDGGTFDDLRRTGNASSRIGGAR